MKYLLHVNRIVSVYERLLLSYMNELYIPVNMPISCSFMSCILTSSIFSQSFLHISLLVSMLNSFIDAPALFSLPKPITDASNRSVQYV